MWRAAACVVGILYRTRSSYALAHAFLACSWSGAAFALDCSAVEGGLDANSDTDTVCGAGGGARRATRTARTTARSGGCRRKERRAQEEAGTQGGQATGDACQGSVRRGQD